MLELVLQEILEDNLDVPLEVVVDLNFTSYPSTKILDKEQILSSTPKLYKNRHHTISTKTGIVKISGILIAMSPLTEFTRSSSFRCSDHSCSNSKVTQYHH